MKLSLIVLAFAVVFGPMIHAALAAPVAATARKSVDGVELPPAYPDHKFHATVPYASAILGARPEEMGRVFNVQKSAALLAKHTKEDLGCDWFVLNAQDCDVVGFSLTDGRISKAVLVHEIVTAARVENMKKMLDAHKDPAVKVEVKPIQGDGKKLSLLLTFEVEPLEFYIAAHAVDAKIAAALRAHTWVEGMTDEQATMVGDGPGRYAAHYPGEAPAGSNSNVGAGTVFAENGGPADLVIIIQARNKKEAREEALKRHKNLKSIDKISGDAKDGAK
jgi:hypothetical protein